MFSEPGIDNTNINTSFRQIEGLAHSTIYYWRVRARLGDRFGEWSPLRQFTTAPKTNPNPVGSLVFDLDPAAGNQNKTLLKGVSAGQTVEFQVWAVGSVNLTGYFVTARFDGMTAFKEFTPAFGASPGTIPGENTIAFGAAILGANASTAKQGDVLLGTAKFTLSSGFGKNSTAEIRATAMMVASLEEPNGFDQPLEIFADAIVTLSGELPTMMGDFNGDGAVNFGDFLLFAGNFGKRGNEVAKFDLNGDGQVGFPDFLLFAAEFGKRQPSAKPLTLDDLLMYLPAEYDLIQNYPNPFNSETTISYELPEAGIVRLSVFDLSGQEIKVLVESDQPAGRYQTVWDGRDGQHRVLASGLYLYRLEVSPPAEVSPHKFVRTKKMLLVR